MKKKLFLILSLLLIIAVAAFWFLKKGENISEKEKKRNQETEKFVMLQQAEMSSFLFVTQESETSHILNIYLTPFINLSIEDKKIKSFKISDFKGSNSKSEVILVPPTELPINTASRTFLFTIQDTITQEDIVFKTNSVEYGVVSEIEKFNQVNGTGLISPYFGVIIKNIGVVNYKEVVEKEGIFDGNKYLAYSGIDLSSLDTSIEFDIRITFEEGGEYQKRFRALLEGEMFATESSPMITLESLE